MSAKQSSPNSSRDSTERELHPPTGSAFDRRRLTRLAAYNVLRNWMIDGAPMGNDQSADEDEMYRILIRIMPRKRPNAPDERRREKEKESDNGKD